MPLYLDPQMKRDPDDQSLSYYDRALSSTRPSGPLASEHTLNKLQSLISYVAQKELLYLQYDAMAIYNRCAAKVNPLWRIWSWIVHLGGHGYVTAWTKVHLAYQRTIQAIDSKLYRLIESERQTAEYSRTETEHARQKTLRERAEQLTRISTFINFLSTNPCNGFPEAVDPRFLNGSDTMAEDPAVQAIIAQVNANQPITSCNYLVGIKALLLLLKETPIFAFDLNPRAYNSFISISHVTEEKVGSSWLDRFRSPSQAQTKPVDHKKMYAREAFRALSQEERNCLKQLMFYYNHLLARAQNIKVIHINETTIEDFHAGNGQDLPYLLQSMFAPNIAKPKSDEDHRIIVPAFKGLVEKYPTLDM